MQEVFIERRAVISMVDALKRMDTQGTAMRQQFRDMSGSALDLINRLAVLRDALDAVPADVGDFDDLISEVNSLSDSLEPMRGAIESCVQSNETFHKSMDRLRRVLEGAL